MMLALTKLISLKKGNYLHYIYISFVFMLLFSTNCQFLMSKFCLLMYNSLKNDLPLLSSSSLQVDVTQNSQFSEFDKFVWKAEILSLSDIANLQHVRHLTSYSFIYIMYVYQLCLIHNNRKPFRRLPV